MSTGNIPPGSRARRAQRRRGAKARGTKTKAEQRGTRDVGRERERTGRKRPSELCFTRGDSRNVFALTRARARVYVCIYRDWRIVGRSERGRKMKKRDEIESRARIGVIGVKRAALAWSRSRRVPW